MAVGRNDPCPCGSGKKYKQCCLKKDRSRGSAPKKFKATLLSGGGSAKKAPDLMQRTFGKAIEEGSHDDKPPAPPISSKIKKKNEKE